jgi:hypothetical protein
MPDPAVQPAILIANGLSAEDYQPPDGAFTLCLNGGFRTHRCNAILTTDCPPGIEKDWLQFPGIRIQAAHGARFPDKDKSRRDLFECEDLVRKHCSSVSPALKWLAKHGHRAVMIVGLDSAWGAGDKDSAGRPKVYNATVRTMLLEMAQLFPAGVWIARGTETVRVGSPEYDTTCERWSKAETLVKTPPAGPALAPADAKPSSPPVFICYYTEHTSYENEAKLLRLSLETHGLESHIAAIPNLGSWQKNTQYKSQFIAAELERLKQPVVWVDADAIVIQRPEALLTMPAGVDLAAVRFATDQHLLSGTVYFSGSPKCMEVVKRWNDLNAKYPDYLPDGRPAWDQRTLDMALMTTPGVRFLGLPQEYTWIIEITQKAIPDLVPVIMHTRGAYRFKGEIDRGHSPKPWVVWPTAAPSIAAKTCRRWQDRGYHVCLLAEEPGCLQATGADKVLYQDKWEGFGKAANRLCREVPGAVVVVAGDDVLPHPQCSGSEIADQFLRAFQDTFGVMQPTGDAYGGYMAACISPWIGRAFIERSYGGKGPYCEEYHHCYSDKELQDVAAALGCFKQEPALVQKHEHWGRSKNIWPGQLPHHKRIGDKLLDDKHLFGRRKAAGFPGSGI